MLSKSMNIIDLWGYCYVLYSINLSMEANPVFPTLWNCLFLENGRWYVEETTESLISFAIQIDEHIFS